MMIVWGHNNFKLKSVQPHEIGLFGEAYKNITFELRQKYAHLFWIPFFPLGKVWVINKGDGNKYVCHAQFEQALNQLELGKTKATIFAWSGFLLIFIGILIFNISEKIDHAKWQAYETTSFHEKAIKLTNKVDSIKPNEFYLFKQRVQGQVYFEYKKNPLKVVEVKADKVLFAAWAPHDDEQKVSSKEDLAKLVNNFSSENSFWVDKALLKKAIVPNKEDEAKFKGVEIKSYAVNAEFILDEVLPMPVPILYQDNYSDVNTSDYAEIMNMGIDVKADSVIAITPKTTWQLSKAKSLKQGEKIAIKANNIGSAILYCSDKNHNKYAIEISNQNGRLWSFEEIEKAE